MNAPQPQPVAARLAPAERPVLVLGAGSDIARAIAAELAGRGHPLMLAARDPARLEPDAADLGLRHRVEVTTHRFDALEVEGHDAFLDALPEMPAIVVCAVGLLGDQEADSADPAAARRVIETNLTGPALALEAAARRMARLPHPTHIIGIGSVAGDRGRARNYVYGAAKAGFAAWLSGLRQRHARTGLHVMTVKPGFVATSMTEGMDLIGPLTTTPEALARRVVAGLDRGRMVHVDLRWKLVMGVVRAVPERVFSRMKF